MGQSLCCCLDDPPRPRSPAPRDEDERVYVPAPDARDVRRDATHQTRRSGRQSSAPIDEDSGSLLPFSTRSDESVNGETTHARCASAPPRESALEALYAIARDGEGGGGRDARSARVVSKDSDAPMKDGVERGGVGDVGHRRAQSVSAAEDVRLVDIKREFARLKSFERTKSSTGDEDYDNSCPTCFEGYDDENPRMTLRCTHHFHLACILEWQEYLAVNDRADTCPCCDQPIELVE